MSNLGTGLMIAAAIMFFIASWRGASGQPPWVIDLVAIGLGLFALGHIIR